ncbi:MAG: hypothetical protein LBT91_02570 [Bifidobacteriaceae bacterium]|jgi:hypothetical protein|nr:hypothetical protein [Bifidobacteriaceae bacterium]
MIISTENAPYEEPVDFVKLPYGTFKTKIIGNGPLTSNGSLPVNFEIVEGENKGKITQEFLNISLSVDRPKVNAFILKSFDVFAGKPAGTYAKAYRESIDNGTNELNIDFIEEDDKSNLKLSDKIIGNLVNIKITGNFNNNKYEQALTNNKIQNMPEPNREEADKYGNKTFYTRFVNFYAVVDSQEKIDNPFTEKVIIEPSK